MVLDSISEIEVGRPIIEAIGRAVELVDILLSTTRLEMMKPMIMKYNDSNKIKIIKR